jgi:SAM-dependent methyltransferase
MGLVQPDPRLDPRPSTTGYAVRAPLVRWLREEAAAAHAAGGPYRLLDVGCGERPYEPVFAPYCASYVGVDAVPNPRADVIGPIEALPLGDAAFDVVLCAQVLEHVDDPAAGVRELHRVTAPGGRVLLSTHGTMVYHPNPVDLWRWTQEGLARVFGAAGDWESVTVSPGGGTTACLGMLTALYTDHVLRRARLGFASRPLVTVINRTAEALDRRVPLLAGTAPGTLTANFHVTAVKAR